MLWPSVSALRAGNTVFSEFLPVLSPEMIVLVARARVFLTEEHASEDQIARLQLVPSCSLPSPRPRPPVCAPSPPRCPIPAGQQAAPGLWVHAHQKSD